MSAQPRSASTRAIEILKEAPAPLDDLHRARLERRFVETAALRAAGASGASDAVTARRGDLAKAGGTSVRRWRAAGAGVAVTVLAAAAVYALAVRTPGPSYVIERVRGGDIALGTVIEVGAGEEARADVFDLSLTASAGARVAFATVSRSDIELELGRGLVRFAFHPETRGSERVTIVTPNARVEIVGTELSVSVEEDATEVSVTEGRVRVVPTSGAEPLFVSANETVRIEDEGAGRTPAALARDEESRALAGSGDVEASLVDDAGESGETAPAADVPESGETAVAVDATGEPSVPASVRYDRAEERLDRDPVGARRELRELAEPGNPRDVRVDALSVLGDSYRDSHETEEALTAYASAARIGRRTPGGASAMYEAARLTESMGNTTAARAGYERYLSEYPDGANAVQARGRLEALGGGD